MSRPPWSRAAGIALAGSLAGLALGVPGPLTASARLTGSGTVGGNTLTTRLACTAGVPYADAVLAAAPDFYWRMAESSPPAVTSVQDATANNRDAVVRGAGLTFGTATAGQIQCDDTYGVRFPGTITSTGFLVRPVAVTNTDTFTLSAWVRTSSKRGGWVLGMGSSHTGSSADRDRVLYVQRNGQAAFSVGVGPRTVVEGPALDDGQPHLLVATLSGAGMRLFVDGALVGSDPSVTAGSVFTGNTPTTPDGFGYWRVGYDSTVGLGPSVPTRNQLAAVIDEVAVWHSTALTATQVSDLYASNHW